MAPHGEYFKDKEEAIAYYGQLENLKDKPAWMIECIIDFARKYPNYKEYCEVEAKVANGQKLTEKQAKKYGHLEWEKQYTDYKNGEVIDDSVEYNEAGTYADIVNDTEEREKMNLYNLTFAENEEPDENIKLRLQTAAGEYEAVANVKEFNDKTKDRPMRPEDFEMTKLDSESIEK